MCEGLHLCTCATCIPGSQGGQKRVSDQLDLQFQTVLAAMWVQGRGRGSFAGSVSVLDHFSNHPHQCLHVEKIILPLV